MIKSETAPLSGNLGDEWIDSHGQSRFWDGNTWAMPADYLSSVNTGSDDPIKPTDDDGFDEASGGAPDDDSGDDESLPFVDGSTDTPSAGVVEHHSV